MSVVGAIMPGSPSNISGDDGGLQKALLSAARFYNHQSNDAFLFRPSAVRGAQRQVVKGVRYEAELDISRTVCRKRDHNKLTDCDFQPKGRLQQTLQCHTVVWVVPWKNETRTLLLQCNT
ncbi:cystatin-F [Centropristis striata]|uniref:cystatin-F n=1 Tax=Centropristis striata TaxID=184440 RepID=UPI0027E1B95B|nr:cystatin-F [Centropristis striata]